jgi:DNA-binding MarR family transcriptional regulator
MGVANRPVASARIIAAPVNALVEELGVALQRYQRSVQVFDDAVERRLGLNPTDLRCLDWLADGPKTAGQLSDATGLRPAATTTLGDRLSRRGLVRRQPSEDDRRTVLVEMPELGFALTWECYGPLVAEGQQPLTDLGTQELAALRSSSTPCAPDRRHRDRVRTASDG